jgi:hypothetical protein
MYKTHATSQGQSGPSITWRILRCGALCCSIGCANIASAQTSVFRCTAPDGSIEFRQQACQKADRSATIELNDRRTGWTPPPGEKPSASKPKGRGKKKRPTSAQDDDKYADRCWNKRQQLERVNAELRAGYKTAQGVKLRRRRSEYEAFLSRYCR